MNTEKALWGIDKALLWLLLLLVLCLQAPAAEALSIYGTHNDGDVHIHLHGKDESVPLAGVHLDIFEVAEGSYFEGKAHLLSDFPESGTHHSLQDMVEHSAEAARDLEEWVEHTHPMHPYMEAISGSDGEIEFDHLEDGIYLVCQENGEHDFDGYQYEVTIEPFLLEIPLLEGDGYLHEEVECVPKAYAVAHQPTADTVSVEKHWEDDNDKAGRRPRSIQVSLYDGDAKKETVTLEAGNNWAHTWSDLPSGGQWTVREEAVPAGYTSTVTQEGKVFVITNRLSDDAKTPPKTPSNGRKTGNLLAKTGDSAPLYLFGALFAGSIAGLAILHRRRRRR